MGWSVVRKKKRLAAGLAPRVEAASSPVPRLCEEASRPARRRPAGGVWPQPAGGQGPQEHAGRQTRDRKDALARNAGKEYNPWMKLDLLTDLGLVR